MHVGKQRCNIRSKPKIQFEVYHLSNFSSPALKLGLRDEQADPKILGWRVEQLSQLLRKTIGTIVLS